MTNNQTKQILTMIKQAKVVWKPLGDIVNVITAPIKVKKEKYKAQGLIPIIDQGEKFIAGYLDDDLSTVPSGEYVIFGDHSEHIKYVDFDFIQGADGLKILKSKEDHPKYLFYAFQNFYIKEKNYKRHWSSAKETLIPIPPLELQKEIVKILDILTELNTDLTTALETEHNLRKKQYQYYRDFLLSENELAKVGFEWKTLGGITSYEQPTKYLVKSKDYNDDFQTPVLTAGKTFILGYTNETNGIYQASKNPVIIFDDFTTANKWVDFDFKAKSSAMKMITSIDEKQVLLKYIYYWLNTLPSGLIDGDHKRQWISNFANKKIPIPPLDTQAKIVAILDKFDRLTSSITDGLPKEIELRRKQYEYYRELLLGFDKN